MDRSISMKRTHLPTRALNRKMNTAMQSAMACRSSSRSARGAVTSAASSASTANWWFAPAVVANVALSAAVSLEEAMCDDRDSTDIDPPAYEQQLQMEHSIEKEGSVVAAPYRVVRSNDLCS